MDKFVKERITFALVLLATVFALHPLTKDYADLGFSMFGVNFLLRYFYLVFTILLCVSVYFYALQFITSKGIPLAEKIGTTAFILALISPLIYALLLIFYLLSIVVTFVTQINWLRPILSIIGVLISIINGILGYKLGKGTFEKQERKEKIERISDEVLNLLETAKRMIETGLFGPAIIQIHSAIISVIKRRLLEYIPWDKRIPDFSILKMAQEKEILTNTDMRTINEIRELRNTFAHPTPDITTNITKNKAVQYIEFASDFISRFEKEFPIDELIEILSKEGSHSFKWFREQTPLKYTDNEFTKVIKENPDILRPVKIVIKDKEGKRIKPSRPGIKLARSPRDTESHTQQEGQE